MHKILNRSFILAGVILSFMAACSSTEPMSSATDAPITISKETNTGPDPAWFDPSTPSRVVGDTVSAQKMAWHSDSNEVNTVAESAAVQLLFEQVDYLSEKWRNEGSSKEAWSASELIRLRRTIKSYVDANYSVLNTHQDSLEGKNGYFAWSKVAIDMKPLLLVLENDFK